LFSKLREVFINFLLIIQKRARVFCRASLRHLPTASAIGPGNWKSCWLDG